MKNNRLSEKKITIKANGEKSSLSCRTEKRLGETYKKKIIKLFEYSE